MAVKVLDRHGRELEPGDRAKLLKRGEGQIERIVFVNVPIPEVLVRSLGFGALVYKTFPTDDPNVFRCPDLELIDPSTEEAK